MSQPDSNDISPAAPSPRQPGWNDMAEDIFGLSLRGFRTMKDLVVRPANVFRAARVADWHTLYTPSVRLVSSLVALMLLLRILWAGEDSAMYQTVLAQIETIAAASPRISDAGQLADQYFNTWAVVFPFVYLAVHFLVSMLVRLWGKDATLVTRVRLYFAALVPGMLIANLSLIVMPFISTSQLFTFTGVYLVLCALAYGLTAYFGLKAIYPQAGARIWRACLFALIALLADTATSMISSVIGGAYGALIGVTGA